MKKTNLILVTIATFALTLNFAQAQNKTDYENMSHDDKVEMITSICAD